MAPIFRRHVGQRFRGASRAYCSLRGAEAGARSPHLAPALWDVPLLDGYSWSQVPNRGSGKGSFFGFESGLWKRIRPAEENYERILCFTGYLRATFWIAYFARACPGLHFCSGGYDDPELR